MYFSLIVFWGIAVSLFAQPQIQVDPASHRFELPLGNRLTALLNVTNDGDSLLQVSPGQERGEREGLLRIGFWRRFLPDDWTFQNICVSLAHLDVNYRLSTFNGIDEAELEDFLSTVSVFIIPNQLNLDEAEMFDLGDLLAATIERFMVRWGGVVVVLDGNGSLIEFLNGSGVLTLELIESSWGFDFRAGELHPVNIGITNYEAATRCNTHRSVDRDAAPVGLDIASGDNNITARALGAGGVVYIGLDWLFYNRGMTDILVNAVLWSQGASTWLRFDEFTGEIEPQDSEDLIFDVLGDFVKSPRRYTRNIVLNSNDPETPQTRIPIELIVTEPQPYSVEFTPCELFVIGRPQVDTTVVVTIRNLGGGIFNADIRLEDPDCAWMNLNLENVYIGPNLRERLVVNLSPQEEGGGVLSNLIQFVQTGRDSVLAGLPVCYYYGEQFGSLTGAVNAAQNGEPVAQAVVSAQGIETETDQQGSFNFPQLPPFRYRVQISHPDFLPFSELARVLTNRETNLEARLQFCDWESDFNNPIVLELQPDSLGEIIGEFTNPGDGVLSFTTQWVDLNPPPLLRPFDLRRQYSFRTELGASQLYGVEYDREIVYIAGSLGRENRIWRFDREGELVGDFLQPEAHPRGMADLAGDGRYIYGSGHRQLVGFDRQGQIGTRIPTPLNFNRAMAYDEQHDWFWIADGQSDIYAVNRRGAEVSRIPNPGLQIQGLAWQRGAPEGYNLIIFSRDGDTEASLSCAHPETDSIRFLAELPTQVGESAGGLALTSQWDCRYWTILTQIIGGRGRTLVYNLEKWPDWVRLMPPNGDIEPQGVLPVSLDFNAFGLDEGALLEGYFIIAGGQRGGADTLRVMLNTPPTEVKLEPESAQPAIWSLALHPNPVNSILLVEVRAAPRTKLSLGLYDLTGRRIIDREVVLNACGEKQEVMDLDDLPSALYLVKLSDGRNQVVRRVVLLR